jgi:hypothetical protein
MGMEKRVLMNRLFEIKSEIERAAPSWLSLPGAVVADKKMAPVKGPFVLHAFFFHHVPHHVMMAMVHAPIHPHPVMHAAVHPFLHHRLVLRAGGSGHGKGGQSGQNQRNLLHGMSFLENNCVMPGTEPMK